MKRVWHRLIREPFLHFLLLGTAIFVTVHVWNSDADRYRIVIGPQRLARLSDTYSKQYGRMPDRTEFQELVEQDIREEILYREGMALDLGKADPIVRRRVAQKFEFLRLDLGADSAIDVGALQGYYAAHLADYQVPATVSFTHVFLSTADSSDPALRATRLRKELERSRAVRAPMAGDRFAGPYDYSALDRESIARVFGDTPVVGALFQTPENTWAGPFRSAYGWHLVFVTSREPQRQLSFDEVRDQVLADYQKDARTTQRAAAFARLRSRYVIVRDKAPG